MKALFPLLVCAGLFGPGMFAHGQVNEGELQLKVTDSVGLGVKAAVRIVSRDNQYATSLATTARRAS